MTPKVSGDAWAAGIGAHPVGVPADHYRTDHQKAGADEDGRQQLSDRKKHARHLFQPDHHDQKQKQHHDRAGVDDDLQGRQKGCPQQVKKHGRAEKRQHQVKHRMDHVAPGDGHGCGNAMISRAMA
jgi:hypothetical protein